MSTYPIKVSSLHKLELNYEISIRNQIPASTVQEMRKQLSELLKTLPTESVKISNMEATKDVTDSSITLNKIKLYLQDEDIDSNGINRALNLAYHLFHRLSRILPTSSEMEALLESTKEEVVSLINNLTLKLPNFCEDLPNLPSTSTGIIPQQLQINVTCDKGISDLIKLKYDGKSCVRNFIQRITEIQASRNVSDTQMFSLASEIFLGNALNWFRSVKDTFTEWKVLLSSLKETFDEPGCDFRLIQQIYSHKQKEDESFTDFMSTMASFFSKLSKPMSEENKLDILLNNIKPCYTPTLATFTKIESLETLRTICKNFDDIHTRLSNKPSCSNSSDNSKQFFKKSFSLDKGINVTSNSNRVNLSPVSSQIFKTNTHVVNFCRKCRSREHNINNCPLKDKIFCFRCGTLGVKTPQCPKCSKSFSK